MSSEFSRIVGSISTDMLLRLLEVGAGSPLITLKSGETYESAGYKFKLLSFVGGPQARWYVELIRWAGKTASTRDSNQNLIDSEENL